jgi:proton glutamate symport protein
VTPTSSNLAEYLAIMTSPQRTRTPLALHWKVLIGLALGVLVGLVINTAWTQTTWQNIGVQDAQAFLAGKAPAVAGANDGATWVAHVSAFVSQAGKFVGDMFIRLLRLIAVPVVLFSLVAAVADVGDLRKLGRLGGLTVSVFATTAVLAVLLGFGMTLLARPGGNVEAETRDKIVAQFADSAAKQVSSAAKFDSDNSLWSQIVDAFASNPFNSLTTGNMLQVVTTSLLLGIGLTLVTDAKRKQAVEMFETLAEACLRVVGLIMHLAPYAVFCLTTAILANLGWKILESVLVFVLATVAGLAIILFVQYPALMYVMTSRQNRMTFSRFFRAMAPAKLLAFSSSSSAATLPVTMACTRRLGVSERVTGFVCPLGTTINMDGTAFYQVMCVTFLAQLFGIELSFAQYVTIGFMAILVAIGSPGLPGASIVLMVFILDAVKVPVEGIGIIIAVDRILDMCRTVVNVAGDAAASVIVASKEGELATAEQSATQAEVASR